ncbi:xylulokinase [Halopolyspora algeriensis]|uniref:Xylulokinase n=1 Tax=Halopolyspora algeriensis TaxID=1500506 RepID=A0A368VYK9_9ACTN|nr:FGGY family carbohydrate kinase [Halopolyspora algeriensis]RCW47296.1 xylulokinase [Halopolyspora algeriensis]TQM42531.1 xylulokinase [Halopolyspora algeriensis]
MSGDSPGDVDAPLVAGVDVATATVRVEVRDADGKPAAAASAPLPRPVRGPGGESEQDAGSWWPAARAALGECTRKLGRRRHAVRALAIAATSGTVVAVDAAGDPVGPALMYDDRRAESEASIAREAGSRRWERIGITPSAGSGLARIGWLAAHADDPKARLLHTPDLIAEHLVGRPVATDTSHALKSGYDPVNAEWAGEALTALGVDTDRLPDVVRPAQPLGRVSPAAAAETGLPAACEVRSGMTDGCAGQLASGAVDPGRIVTVLGTTLVVKGVSAELVHDPTGAVYSHLHPDGAWLPGGASNTGGEALSDVNPGRLARLDRAAGEHGPSGTVCYPLRRDGERFPFPAPQARGFLLEPASDEIDLHRARLEGVAFCERLALERMGKLGVAVTSPILTTGGGARSRLWCGIRASVLGRPVARVPRAGTALGAALLAATGTLHPDLSTAAHAMVPAPERIDPIVEEAGPLAANYRRFLEALHERGWLNS